MIRDPRKANVVCSCFQTETGAANFKTTWIFEIDLDFQLKSDELVGALTIHTIAAQAIIESRDHADVTFG